VPLPSTAARGTRAAPARDFSGRFPRAHYETLQQRANRAGPFLEWRPPNLNEDYDHLLKNHDHLAREYADLQKELRELRRPFSVSTEVPYTDVWNFPTVDAHEGKHPCEKPLEMMEHIVEASSRAGGVVLDCFMGSGVTGLAALRCGRQFIGFERDPAWFAVASERLAAPQFPRRRPVRKARPLPLFE
jgi:adenine-specific DNA-methyltransferase